MFVRSLLAAQCRTAWHGHIISCPIDYQRSRRFVVWTLVRKNLPVCSVDFSPQKLAGL
ncbi:MULTISPECIES: hypothetical protein [unclassified Microcoleus]|uniref:hypothetical protein n=1 Tax=unclassified Microcoleus TaxID=2642155 RepID=UPI0025CE47E5|nr:MULTISPECIES: hypothetical protein [unclassified Microcoleus]